MKYLKMEQLLLFLISFVLTNGAEDCNKVEINSLDDSLGKMQLNEVQNEELVFNKTDIDSLLTEMEKMNLTDYRLDLMRDIFPGYGEKWMIFPGGDKKLRVIDLNVVTARTFYTDMDKVVTFHLFTRKNIGKSQIIHPYRSLNNTNFDVNKKVKVLIHGWISSYQSDICQKVKNAYLYTEDVNVLCVDWNPIAQDVLYIRPMMETKNVGEYTAKMMNFLVTQGVQATDIHLVGHSLGAHISGFTGKFFRGSINRITGLDPALPGFEVTAGRNNKLDKTDAEFVDVIHTCAGALGHYYPLGHADFYPNRGTPPQPGCLGLPPFIEACSHGRSVEYFIEAIMNRDSFQAVQCKVFYDFETNNCDKLRVPMGPETPQTARGLFYLRTNTRTPYAIKHT